MKPLPRAANRGLLLFPFLLAATVLTVALQTVSLQTSFAQAQPPAGDAPAASETEGPAVEGPAAEEPAATDGSATDGSATDGSATDGSATDGSATDGAAPEIPATETPAAEAPATEGPALEHPAAAGDAAGAAGGPAAAAGGAGAPPAVAPMEVAPAGGAAAAPAGNALRQLKIVAIVAALFILPFWIGAVVGRRMRMPDHAWKIGLALFAISAGTLITAWGWPPKLGPDLSGGINLIYEVDPNEKDVDRDKMIAALSRRVNPGGVKEVTIRPYGSRQVEIIIPRADAAEVQLIKDSITTAGMLEFRITANDRDHSDLIKRAQANPDVREVRVGDIVEARWVGVDQEQFPGGELQQFVTRVGSRGRPEVLVVMDPYNVTGDQLSNSARDIDERGGPAVMFSFKQKGRTQFGRLTTDNRPDPADGFRRQLGIVLDNVLLSAPNLNEPITQGRGQISGNFTEQEVDFLVSILNAGSLPAALVKTPISEQSTSATLGADTVQRGAWAMGVSMIAVLIFMLIYYRFAGIVACLALAANLVLILAVMITIKAAFTLPGIAGLVLTVGMAVDANVLIFERIREEMARGAALRMAIRNGFARATTTIVDANLTTLITAIVLFTIGTDQIKGFAVTLILGILMSMFTAIFCSRIVFDIAERARWITRLTMMHILGKTNIDFIGKRRIAAVCSLAVIVLGLVCVSGRGRNILDIDFLGGSSVTLAFKEPQKISDVRKAVSELPDVAVVGVGEDDRSFKIDTSIRDFAGVQTTLQDIFGDELRVNSLTYTPPASITDGGAARENWTTSLLQFGEPIKRDTLDDLVEKAFKAAGLPVAAFDVSSTELEEEAQPGTELEQRTGHAVKEWNLQVALEADQAKQLLQPLADNIATLTVFPSASNIGGKVAGDTQTQAGYALFISLLSIVAYIWLRFQRIMFGLAAVVALFHDVLVTLGAIAISKYVVDLIPPLASALMLDPFKISLSIVAAFLTIIGYSLNDTIVVFDRIREIRGKSPQLTAEMINTSINQTLSRTVLTSVTTLIVVAILYVAGGPGIHGFAFALVVGVVVGTYSSIFVASPVLLWLAQPSKADEPATSKSSSKARAAM